MEDDLKLIIALMCMKETRLALRFSSKFWIFSCTPKINPSLLPPTRPPKKKKKINPSLRAQNSVDTMVYILFLKNNPKSNLHKCF